MNHWKILKRAFFQKSPKPHFAINVQCSSEAEIMGEILIGENTNVGKSRIVSEKGSVIAIGRNTNIRDHILISAGSYSHGKIKNIFIGNKVFISSNVEIYGPTLISDETFIGGRTMIINSDIGKGCLIEDNVLIKNIVVPSGMVIPSRSVIDSMEGLNEILLNTNQGGFCQIESQNINNGRI